MLGNKIECHRISEILWLNEGLIAITAMVKDNSFEIWALLGCHSLSLLRQTRSFGGCRQKDFYEPYHIVITIITIAQKYMRLVCVGAGIM